MGIIILLGRQQNRWRGGSVRCGALVPTLWHRLENEYHDLRGRRWCETQMITPTTNWSIAYPDDSWRIKISQVWIVIEDLVYLQPRDSLVQQGRLCIFKLWTVSMMLMNTGQSGQTIWRSPLGSSILGTNIYIRVPTPMKLRRSRPSNIIIMSSSSNP